MKMKKNMSLKREKKNLANPDEYLKIELISQTHNPWNLRFGLNQVAKFPVILMLKDETQNKYQFKEIHYSKWAIETIQTPPWS